MVKHAFCDTCPGCRPALLDPTTGKVLKPDHPIMVKVNRVWQHETTYAQRKAFVEVCCEVRQPESVVVSSRNAESERLANQVIEKIQAILSAAGGMGIAAKRK